MTPSPKFPTQESDQVEFKLSFQDEVIVSLVAFANHKGGIVYVGVADNGNPRTVVKRNQK